MKNPIRNNFNELIYLKKENKMQARKPLYRFIKQIYKRTKKNNIMSTECK